MKAIGLLVTSACASFITMIFQGFVITQLWSWFIVEHFHLAKLPLIYAIGVSILIGLLVSQSSSTLAKERNYKTGEVIFILSCESVSVSAVYLVMGYVAHLFT